jgi:hypothetical protein
LHPRRTSFFSTAKAAYPQSCAHGKVPIRRPSTEI